MTDQPPLKGWQKIPTFYTCEPSTHSSSECHAWCRLAGMVTAHTMHSAGCLEAAQPAQMQCTVRAGWKLPNQSKCHARCGLAGMLTAHAMHSAGWLEAA
jgi:hypothetical protein